MDSALKRGGRDQERAWEEQDCSPSRMAEGGRWAGSEQVKESQDGRDMDAKPGGCGQNGVSELTISKEKKARPGVALAVGNNSTGSKGHPVCTQPRPTRTKAIPPSHLLPASWIRAKSL